MIISLGEDSEISLFNGTNQPGASAPQQENKMIKFTACKHLRFDDGFLAKKQVLGSGKVFWMRDVHPSMVQFCGRRGRINNPEACTDKKHAWCSCYEECVHEVEESSIPD